MPLISSTILSWPLALLTGFFAAIMTLVIETLFTISGQVFGLIPTDHANTIIQSSVVFLALVAIIEEGIKYVTVHSFPFLTSRINAFFTGLGFALLEPLLFRFSSSSLISLPLPEFASNSLLHTTTFVLYAFSLPRRPSSVAFLVIGSVFHILFNIFLAHDMALYHMAIEILLGFILFVSFFYPRQPIHQTPEPTN